MDVLLLSMPDSFEHMAPVAIRMPNGALGPLAANLVRHHRVAIADLILAQGRVAATVESLLRERRPDVVGLSGMTFQRRTALRVAALVKTLRPSARVVVGGYDPSLAPEAWTDVADVIVRGEGEITFRELLRAIEAGGSPQGIAGLWFRNGNGWSHNPPRPVSRLGACAERAGISSASWPIFGVVWPSGLALAEEMYRFPIDGKSIPEVGCGIGLPSLVLQQLGANITASDHHPLAEEFLRHNTDLNGLAPIHFFKAAWIEPNLDLGGFDLIIGSDLLYEREHPSLLAGFLADHANPSCQIHLANPGRSRRGQFSAHMASQGYACTEWRLRLPGKEMPFFQGRLLSFVRVHA